MDPKSTSPWTAHSTASSQAGTTTASEHPSTASVMPNPCEVTRVTTCNILLSSTPDLTLQPRNASSTALGPTCMYCASSWCLYTNACGGHVPSFRMHTLLPRCACDNNQTSSLLPILPSYIGHLSLPLSFHLVCPVSQLTGLCFGSPSRRSNGSLGLPQQTSSHVHISCCAASP